jgi:parallel beta-helix repeat protein
MAAALFLNYDVAKGQTSITILASGAISPQNSPVTTLNNVTYTLTADISDNIVIQRSNAVIDGNGFTLHGPNPTTSYGITLDTVRNVTIINMNVIGYSLGVYAVKSNQSIITRSSIVSTNGVGIFLWSSNNNKVSGNSLTNGASNGLYVYSSSNNTIIGNNVTSNNAIGIELDRSSTNNIITQNYVANNKDGGVGMYYGSTNTTILGNYVTLNNGTGILTTYSSTGCTISNNTIAYNRWTGIGTPGYGIDALDQYTTITGNNITGNVASGIRVGASNISVIGNSLLNNDIGVAVVGVYSPNQNENITGNTITSNINYGIYISGYQTGITINQNLISNCSNGIWLDPYTNTNTIIGNVMSFNNAYGLVLSSASGNTVYHNSFMNNTVQAATNVANTWDNGYPSGGNYWSDCNCNDTLSGPAQNAPGADGIGDTPYLVDASGLNKDRYPLLTVSFNQSGVASDFTGPVLNVDQNPLNVTQIPKYFSWTPLSVHSYSFQSPLVVQQNVKRYVWMNCTGLSNTQNLSSLTVPNYGSIKGNYIAQYFITIAATPAGATGGTFQLTYTQLGFVNSAEVEVTPWSGWVDAGTIVTLANPQQLVPNVSGTNGWRYNFSSYSPSQSVTTDSAKTINLNYVAQCQVTFVATPAGTGSTSPVGTDVWFDGGSLSITAMPAQGYQFSQWTKSTDSISLLNANSQSTTATINGPGSITATFVTIPAATPTPSPNPTPAPTPAKTPNPTLHATPTSTVTSYPTPTVPEFPLVTFALIALLGVSTAIFFAFKNPKEESKKKVRNY